MGQAHETLGNDEKSYNSEILCAFQVFYTPAVCFLFLDASMYIWCLFPRRKFICLFELFDVFQMNARTHKQNDTLMMQFNCNATAAFFIIAKS